MAVRTPSAICKEVVEQATYGNFVERFSAWLAEFREPDT